MLSRAQNDLLTRVGPGTPMGELFSRYWIPAMLSSDLIAEGERIKTRLLGRQYLAYRQADGQAGFFDEASGEQRSYPTKEAGDLVWVYLGEPERAPRFREYEYMTLPASHRVTIRLDMDCNYFQLIEGALDSGHIGMLHGDFMRMNAAEADALPEQMRRQSEFATDLAPLVEVRRTEFGLQYVALRSIEGSDGERYARVTAYVAPSTVMIPPNLNILHYIPYDDTHTGWIVTHWNKDRPVDRERALYAQGLDTERVWVNGHIMMSIDNGYLQDREAMRSRSFSGLGGVLAEDAAVALAQGPILDRTKEHLVQGDAACAAVRKLLFEALKGLEQGDDPPGIAPTSSHTIQALDFVVGRDKAWPSEVPGNIELAGIGERL